ncbi:MAG TPA: hypothetical protein VLD37_06215 [Candidatus Bilamarchaeum sp.]|nr:hypothetical protein [Candidatus Bilamarchaeum sp.]
MGSAVTNILLLVVAAVLGIGVTYFGTGLVGGIDEQTQIIIAVVLTLFAWVALYFMAKGRGGG